MSFLHVHFSEIDTQISQFARAIALPIRVFILRMIAENGNSLAKQAFYTTAFNAETINKHIQELRGLGIIKVRNVKSEARYYIDEKLFGQMSANFNLLFDQAQITPLEEEQHATAQLPAAGVLDGYPHFGAFVKGHRLELNLSQAAVAQKLNIDRALLSRIECGKKVINVDTLPLLAKALYIDIDELKHAYEKLPALL